MDRAQFFLECILSTIQTNYLPTDLCAQALVWARETATRAKVEIDTSLMEADRMEER